MGRLTRMATNQVAQRVAAEVRAHLARHQVRTSDVASALGFSQSALARRLQGLVAFDVTELAAIADMLPGVTASDLLPREQVSAR